MNHSNAEGTDNTKLYHLSSRRAASNDMNDDIISAVSKSTTWADKFRQGKSVKKTQPGLKNKLNRGRLQISQIYAKKMNIPQKALKVKEVLCTRDIWGRLVYLTVVQNLALEHVMSYPMTMVPLSLAYIDGAMSRTDTASLMRKLESCSSRMLICV